MNNIKFYVDKCLNEAKFEDYYYNFFKTHPGTKDGYDVVPFKFNINTFCTDLLFLRDECVYMGEDEDGEEIDAEIFVEHCNWDFVKHMSSNIDVYEVTLDTDTESYVGKHNIIAKVKVDTDDENVIGIISLTVDNVNITNKNEMLSFRDFANHCLYDGFVSL